MKSTVALQDSDRSVDDERIPSGVRPLWTRHEHHEAVYDRQENAQHVLDQALSLPSEYREPLLLRCVQAMTYQQISETLELPVTTIETRLARARKMLREELSDELTERDAVKSPNSSLSSSSRPAGS